MKVQNAEFIKSAVDRDGFVHDGRSEVAFVGRSNVGKSSLLNRLLQRNKLARTSSTPGRTRAVNYFLLDKERYFVDLPGYGWARAGRDERESWGKLVESYFEEALPEARVVLLVDSRVGATVLDVQAWQWLQRLEADTVVVATKVDKLKRSQRHKAMKAIRESLQIAGDSIVSVSAQSGEGIAELWSRILAPARTSLDAAESVQAIEDLPTVAVPTGAVPTVAVPTAEVPTTEVHAIEEEREQT